MWLFKDIKFKLEVLVYILIIIAELIGVYLAIKLIF